MRDDAEVILRVIQGDLDSFRLLVKRYERPVLCAVRNLVRDNHICEDLTQEVFLTAFRHLRRYDSRRASFSTWLLTIARNKCLNVLKRKAPVPTGDFPQEVMTRTPHDQLVEEETFLRLDEALDALPLSLKTAFVLCELVGLPYGEVAEIEGIQVTSVRSRVSRARERLRSLLWSHMQGDMPER